MSHFYDEHGNPRHFEGKDGAGTTLREARKLGLYPSVTTVLQVVSKYQLEMWKQREAAKAAALVAIQNPLAEFNDEWAADVINTAAKERMEATADVGTEIHDALERYGMGQDVAPEWLPACEAVNALILEKTGYGIRDFDNEVSFCDTDHGYAGKCDLSGHGWVIDYKSKDAKDIKPNMRGWPDQAEQLAAYARGLEMPATSTRIANVFVARAHDGDGPWPCAWFEHKDDHAWDRFSLALTLWQVSKKYGPLFDVYAHLRAAA